MNIGELFNLIEEFFGYKADMQSMDVEKKEITFWLYNSFLIKCCLDERYNSFGAGVVLGNQESTVTEFLGERCSLDNDEDSIKQSLLIIENYCKLRLPDKFLHAFEDAYHQ